MDNQEKIEKLENLINLLEQKPRFRKLPLEVAKANLVKNDPGFELSNALKVLNNKTDSNEVLAAFISENLFKPLLIRLLKRIL